MLPRFAAILVAVTLGLAGWASQAEAHITLNTPNGGETLTARSKFTIVWTVFDQHLPGDVLIDLSTDGGNTWTQIDAKNSPGGTGQVTYSWTVNNVSSSQCRIKITNSFPGGQEIDWSDANFTIQSVSGSFVAAVDGRVGKNLGFLVESPPNTGDTGIVFLSLTGGTVSLSLPGGVVLHVDPDALMLVMLSNPLISTAVIDGVGLGATGAIPLPNNPALAGTNLWAAAGVWNSPAGPFVDGTPTLNFQIQ